MKTMRWKQILELIAVFVLIFAVFLVGIMCLSGDVARADDGSGYDSNYANKVDEWWSLNQNTVIGYASLIVSGLIGVLFAYFKKKVGSSVNENSGSIKKLISKYEESLKQSNATVETLQEAIGTLKQYIKAEAITEIKDELNAVIEACEPSYDVEDFEEETQEIEENTVYMR